MKENITFRDIKNDLEINSYVKERYIKTEDNWVQYDSSLRDIGNSFRKTLPKEYVQHLDKKMYGGIYEFGKAFKLYIEDSLSHSPNRERTAIEFGGPGSNLFSDFTKGFFGKTVGVCLSDIRNNEQIEKDKLISHSVVEGDLLKVSDEELFLKISRAIGFKKADLIISRMMGPLKKIQKNPILLDRIIRKWYSLLNENGILFAQFEYFKQHNPYMDPEDNDDLKNPPFETDHEEYVRLWAKTIEDEFPNQIEIELGRGVIRLAKKDGAPKELPSSKELFANVENLTH